MKQLMNILVPIVVAGYIAASCSSAKPIVRTVVDIARELCALHFSEADGISFEDAAETACKTEQQIRPFIDAILAARQDAAKNLTPDAEPSAPAPSAPSASAAP